ncbi:hypothetical protein ACH4OY_10465 [Micromonospora rubida]|uniref:MOSC domain-containing protein n=1 Tax=Micromonospora rubida TaxID=2697657 RepID=A0ABW7SHE5_9ACTN
MHLFTTATLDRIGAQLPGGTVGVGRYRPNLVLRAAGAPTGGQ